MGINPNPKNFGHFPYGTTIVPLANEHVIHEADEILKRGDKVSRMRDAAVRGDDSADPAEVIREIHADFGERIGRDCQQASEDLRELGTRVESASEIDPQLTITSVAGEVRKTIQQRQEDVKSAKAAEIKARLNRRRFQVDRGIDRDPRQPNIGLTLLLIVAALCVELLVGTWLYSGVETDLTGAMFLAGLFSVSLAGLGLLTGFVGLRHAMNGTRESWSRRIATIGGVAGVLGMFYLALLIAHDRDHLAAFDPSQEFIRRFNFAIILEPWEWFHFETLEGPGFLVLLVLLGAVSLWKGYDGFRDPIPGYGERHAAWRHAANEAEDRIRDLRQAAYAPIERETAIVDRTLEENRAVLQRAAPLLEAADNREQQHRATTDILLSIANTAIRKAQEAYLDIRPQRPSYFDQYLSAEHVPALPMTSGAVKERVADLARAVAQNREYGRQVKLRLNELLTACDRAVQRFVGNLEQLGADKVRHELRVDLDSTGDSA